MSPNPGHCPPGAIGKRVRVHLRDGTVQGLAPVSNESPAGWRADTTNWRLTGSQFDVLEWELAT